MGKKTLCLLLVGLLIAGLGGCSSGLSRLAQGAADKDGISINTLRANQEEYLPELAGWLGAGDKKDALARGAFAALGEDGLTFLMARYRDLSPAGQASAVSVIAQPADSRAILRLIALMDGGAGDDAVLAALTALGEPAVVYLTGLLHTDYYPERVNRALEAFGESAVPRVMQALDSVLPARVGRAIDILTAIGEPAVPALVTGILALNKPGSEAFQRAGDMLRQHAGLAIPAIFAAVDGGAGVSGATQLLVLLGEDELSAVFGCTVGSEATRSALLRAYLDRVTVQAAVNLALVTGDEAVRAGLGLAFADGEELEDSVAGALLLKADGSGAVAGAAPWLLPEGRARDLVLSVSAGDAQTFIALVQGLDAQGQLWVGRHLSQASDNALIPDRCAEFLAASAGDGRLAVLTTLASAGAPALASLVFDELKAGDETRQDLALTALINTLLSSGEGNRFAYADFDYQPYAAAWGGLMLSQNADLAAKADTALTRVPPESAQHAFFTEVFLGAPSQYLLSVLSDHYIGDGAVTPSLTFPADGGAAVTGAALTTQGSISGLVSEDQPKLDATAKSMLEIIGLASANSGDEGAVTLAIHYSGRLLDAYYPGMNTRSYVGARVEIRWTVGDQTFTTSGQITPPRESPAAEGAKEYMAKPADAPVGEAFIIAMAQGLYQAFGPEPLFVLYRNYPEQVLAVAHTLWPERITDEIYTAGE